MAKVKQHELLDDDNKYIATVSKAKRKEIKHMLSIPETGDDNRSNWVWIRLSNGDLIFGCFPQGNTYEMFSEGK